MACLFALPALSGCEYFDVQQVPLVGAVRLNPIHGPLTIQTAVGENQLPDAGPFDTAVYTASDAQNLEVLLVDGPIDNPTRVMHVRMFWKSRAGKTPFDPSATNSTVRYIVFNHDGVSIYGGGGLLSPRDTLGSGSIGALLENASLRLMDTSSDTRLAGAEPLLAEGTFSAQRDKLAMREMRQKIQQLVNDRLGYTRVVWEAPAPSDSLGG